MILGEPSTTDFDIRFSLFRIPVRVHPLFFVLPVFWGVQLGDGMGLLIFILIFFVSILVHELGHALTMITFGRTARIVLYMMGGLAINDKGRFDSGRQRTLTTQEEIMISFAGPAAGFLLAMLLMGVVKLIGGEIIFSMKGVIPLFFVDLSNTALESNRNMQLLFQVGIWINIYLNLLNLLPIYPLDGGQIARHLLVQKDPWNGVKNSLWLSLIVAGITAVIGLTHGDRFLGFFFGYMAFMSYMALQNMNTGGFGGGGRPW